MFCIPISPVMGRMTTNDTPRFGQPSRLPSSREPSALPRAWWLLWIPMNPSLAWPTWGIRDSGGKDMDYMCVELWVYFIALYYILNYVLRKHVSIIYNALILYCVYYIFNSCYIYYLNYIYIYGNNIKICGGRSRPRGPGGSIKYQFVCLNVVTVCLNELYSVCLNGWDGAQFILTRTYIPKMFGFLFWNG
jgi:hypothetical protein